MSEMSSSRKNSHGAMLAIAAEKNPALAPGKDLQGYAGFALGIPHERASD